MGWYDLFASFYDSALEELYREQRAAAAEALELGDGMTVLDLPCGTGQSFDAIVPELGDGSRVLGVDLSSGMLGKAQDRVRARGFDEKVVLRRSDVHAIDQALLTEALGVEQVDRVHVFLGMTAFPDHRRAFETLWDRLVVGGRFVMVDVYAEKPDLNGKMVNLVARADITRRPWEPLEQLGRDFVRTDLPSLPKHGGQIYLAHAEKPPL